MFRSFDNRFKGMDGSPLLFAKYLPGIITMTGGKTVKHDQVNFDAYANELLVMRNGVETVVAKSMITGFLLMHNFDSLNFVIVRDGEGKVFMREVVIAEIGLFEKSYKSVKQPNNTGAYSSGNTYGEFIDEKDYYWKAMDNDVAHLIKNKKMFLADFSEIEKELSAYLKENKVSFKKEEDLIALIAYTNRMLVQKRQR